MFPRPLFAFGTRYHYPSSVTFFRRSFNPSSLLSCSHRRFFSSSSSTSSDLTVDRNNPIGQPHPVTHPHLFPHSSSNRNEITPGISADEYSSRRSSLVSDLPSPSLAVIFGADTHYMTTDIPYVFRQNSNFFYLTGCCEPGCVLTVSKDSSSKVMSTLFVPKRNKDRELWDGPRVGASRASSVFHVDTSLDISELESYLTTPFHSSWSFYLCPVGSDCPDEKMTSDAEQSFLKMARNVSQSFVNSNLLPSSLAKMRLRKSPSEMTLMKIAGEHASAMHNSVMQYCQPGMTESHLGGYMQFAARREGSVRLSFPPVVAGGSNALTLHYISNEHVLNDETMVLIDSGTEYFGYCSDISRSFPVNGQFTPAQAEVYERVVDVNEKCIEVMIFIFRSYYILVILYRC